MRSRGIALGWLPLAVVGSMFLSGCGGTGPGRFTTGGGNLSVAVSATNTCGIAAPGSGNTSGPYSHVYISISDVQASPNANATPGDGSFVDVTPGLTSAPKLVDLLATPNQCAVATLAANLSLAAGNYQQFRVFLTPDRAVKPSSPCGAFSNCVTLASDPTNTPFDLQVGTETTQGIAVGTNQIAGGQFTPSGQAQILNLAFNSCASVVALSANQFRLKPVLTMGDATNAPTVTGQLVDSATNQPVPSGEFLVALEAPDTRLVDRVILDTHTDNKGNFSLCPVMAGSYDVVASGVRTDTKVSYGATATLGVSGGASLGAVPMVAVSALPATPAGVLGAVTSQTTVAQPASVDVTVSALQSSGTGPNVLTVPPAGGFASTTNVPSQPGASCPTGTDCATFEIALPAASPLVGQFSPTGTSYVQSTGVPSFQIEGTSFAPLSGATPFCAPSFQSVNTGNLTPGGLLDLTPTPLSFNGCQ